jgi:hypothetical protein
MKWPTCRARERAIPHGKAAQPATHRLPVLSEQEMEDLNTRLQLEAIKQFSRGP